MGGGLHATRNQTIPIPLTNKPGLKLELVGGVCHPCGVMSREEQILSWIRQGLARFSRELEGYQVVLFGSRARRDHRPSSDFDFGVYGPRPLPLATFYEIGDFLDDLPTLYRLDWVDLNRAAPSVRNAALQHAEVLYG